MPSVSLIVKDLQVSGNGILNKQVGTGLLVAEVNVNTMCELGSGGVSLVSFSQLCVESLFTCTS